MDIVVLGGTFAPPTKAHMALMQAAMDFTGADKGVFVPSSLSYMRLWRPDRLPEAPFCDDGFREGMLRAMCEGVSGMEVYPDEMRREGGAYTFDTLSDLREKFGGRVSFIMGSDLIPGLPDWHRSDELRKQFDIIAVSRDADAEKAIAEKGVTGVHVMPFTDMYAAVSATLVRRAIIEGDMDAAREYLEKPVFDYISRYFAENN